jgi:hypothetical protein
MRQRQFTQSHPRPRPPVTKVHPAIPPMDSLFTTGLGLTIRAAVNSLTSHAELSASVVGICEGFLLFHSRPGTPSYDPSFHPYLAYGIRVFLDLLYTQSFVRMVIVMLFTGLGIVFADVLSVGFTNGQPPTRRLRSTRGRTTRTHISNPEPVIEHRRRSRVVKSSELPLDVPRLRQGPKPPLVPQVVHIESVLSSEPPLEEVRGSLLPLATVRTTELISD